MILARCPPRFEGIHCAASWFGPDEGGATNQEESGRETILTRTKALRRSGNPFVVAGEVVEFLNGNARRRTRDGELDRKSVV